MEHIHYLVEKKQADLIALVQRLIRIPSISGQEQEVQLVIADEMKRAGLSVDIWYPAEDSNLPLHPAYTRVDSRNLAQRPNVVGTLPGSGSAKSIMLNGHADVVPPGDPTTWTVSPWDGEILGNRLYGRGSCDMKANLAVALYVIRLLLESGARPGGEVQLHSVIGEETGGIGTLASLARGYQADAALLLEPTGMNIVPAQAGAATFRLTIKGQAAHGSMRDSGINPIEKFLRIHTALLELERQRNDIFAHPFYAGIKNKIPLSIGTLHAGVWHSSVPDKLTAEGRYGVRVGESLEEAQAEFEACLRSAEKQDPWLQKHPTVLEWIEGQFESTEVSATEPILQELISTVRKVARIEPTVAGVTYGSDMRLIVNYGKIPAVLFGAGEVSLAHAADENIEIPELLTMAKVLASFLASWSGFHA